MAMSKFIGAYEKALTFAVWEAEVAISTAITVPASVVRLAWTLAPTHFTHTVLGAVIVALTGDASRIAIVTQCTATMKSFQQNLRGQTDLFHNSNLSCVLATRTLKALAH